MRRGVRAGDRFFAVGRTSLQSERKREQKRAWFEILVLNVLARRIIPIIVSVSGIWAVARALSP
jgi:hypothetical protein